MSANENDQRENLKLLMEIFNLKMKLGELYLQTGPVSSTYISLKIKLDILIKEYMDERLVALESYPHLVETVPVPMTH